MNDMHKIVTDNDEDLYAGHRVKLAKDAEHFGRMNDPTGSTYFKGACGDEMEFYLVIKDRIIEEMKLYTEEYIATRICDSMTAQLALGKTVDDAIGVSPRKVIDLLKGLPENDRHCSILAVSTL